MLPPQLENGITGTVEIKDICVGVTKLSSKFEENLHTFFYEHEIKNAKQLPPKMWYRISFCFAPVSAG